jgi:predicted hydrocarbon binding protein
MELTANRLIALSQESLVALRAALFRDCGGGAAALLQEAGYAGGPAVYAAFGRWLAARGEGTPSDVPSERFPSLATAFFRECGWGSLALAAIGGIAAADSPDWSESDPSQPLDFPGCYYTAGVFAHFFGELAAEPVAVMEVECRSAGGEQCRFLLGTPEALQTVYDQMGAGVSYVEAAAALSPAGGNSLT